MTEITKVKGTNGLKVVSTFSGCGGSCLGFEMAGFDVVWASEFVPAAREVYRLNHPNVPLDGRDIREVATDSILDATNLREGELDVLEGSPPCASFSTSGKRSKYWGEVKKYSDTYQRTDDLFFEFARILRGLMPRAFVAENVSGLAKGVAKGYFKEILAALKACGYTVSARILDAQWLGVPQVRKRLIFVGVREDLGAKPSHPKPLPFRYSLSDAILDMTSDPSRFNENTSIVGYAIEREWDRILPGEGSSKYLNLYKPRWDRPCPTVTQAGGKDPGIACVVHHAEKRKFTIAELKRICGFPDDFRLIGTYAQQWERLGRAVPPPMMRAVAEVIRDEVLPRGDTNKGVPTRVS
jgi:DNA (cytosine-5)-methyltransferase 1